MIELKNKNPLSLLTTEEVAQFFQVDPHTIGNWRSKGLLKYYKFNIKEYHSIIVIKDNSLEEADEFFIVECDGNTSFYKKIRCKDAN